MRGREQLHRWAAPVGFLLVLTIAVVVIHNGLSGGGAGNVPTAATRTAPPATATAATIAKTERQQTTQATTTSAAEYYVVQSGDTFGSIAAHYGTTVSEIEALNPGVSSTALSVGQKIRVR